MAFDFDVEKLRPLIHQILSSPQTDFSQISAKAVRRSLLTLSPSLTPRFLKENKDDIDAVITEVYSRINSGRSPGPEEEDAQDSASESPQPEPPKRKPPLPIPRKAAVSDAELARQLSSEINGTRSTRRGASRASSSTKKTSRKKKSSELVESDDDEEDGDRKAKSKSKARRQSATPSAGGARGGLSKEYILSPPLAALLQADKLSRPQVVKQLWVYIKSHELQNPQNKKVILCDPSFRAVFNVDSIDMFKMNKVLGNHLHDNE
ncbi:SWIB/MDM2 domain-containing protein [Mycena floridula]|nr:SWIB/MDM2 domain-containing protein [Mycena floridula]